MSNLLQRLIDRTRAPLSAVQPVMPSVYAPAARSEIESEPMPEITESITAPVPFQSQPAQTPPPPGRGQPAVTDPAGSESQSMVRPATPTPDRLAQTEPSSASHGKDTGLPPTAAEESSPMQGNAALPPARRSGVRQKNREPGPVIKTFVPRNFASRTAHKIGEPVAPAVSETPLPSEGLPSDRPLRQEAEALPPALKPHAPASPPVAKAALPAEQEKAAKLTRAKAMLSATMKWIGGEQPAPSTAGTAAQASRSDAPVPPEAPVRAKTSRPLDPAGTDSRRESREGGFASPASRDPFSTRPMERPAQKPSSSDDSISAVEVNVSIGHIEVKSAAPTPPAPRRAPPRPRVTLEEFLKHPHYGGPR